jgi:tetratricopeptide (TPR) repeat protein
MSRLEGEKVKWTNQVRIHQYPTAKVKKNDLPLLKEFVKEYPHDLRALAYLGREYCYVGDYKNAAICYKKYVAASADLVELGQAYLYLAEAEPEFAIQWLDKAQKAIPDHREPLVAKCQYYYKNQNWKLCLETAEAALSITKHPMTYICTPEAWGARPHDLAAIAAWNLNLYEKAVVYGEQAVKLDPTNVRLSNNLNFYKLKVN